MTGQGRGRGRPVVFDGPAREVFLATLRAGAPVGEAAAQAGVSRNVPARHAHHDRVFAAALAAAREQGRTVRAERRPHGESRYVHQACRCPHCRSDATAKRLARPDRATTRPREEVTAGAPPRAA